MKEYDPSGPAFPCNEVPMIVGFDKPGGEATYGDVSSPGMSLRDYFAAAALTGLLAEGEYQNFVGLAALAYEAADAMLKERQK